MFFHKTRTSFTLIVYILSMISYIKLYKWYYEVLRGVLRDNVKYYKVLQVVLRGNVKYYKVLQVVLRGTTTYYELYYERFKVLQVFLEASQDSNYTI